MAKKTQIGVKQAAITMLLLGFSLGYVVSYMFVGEASEPEPMASHAHNPFDAGDYEQIPTVEIEVIEDAKKGYNLFIKTENFTFAPEAASTAHVDGEGHAHLYINNQKITRLYGPHYYIGELEPGDNLIKVSLSTNDHKDYFNLDQEIEDTVLISEDGTVQRVNE